LAKRVYISLCLEAQLIYTYDIPAVLRDTGNTPCIMSKGYFNKKWIEGAILNW
jgi:hypothetical protein